MICDECFHSVVCKNEDYDLEECPEFFELIRCKDCKYFEKSKYSADDKSVLGFCKFQEEPWWDTEFCSHGERKETE